MVSHFSSHLGRLDSTEDQGRTRDHPTIAFFNSFGDFQSLIFISSISYIYCPSETSNQQRQLQAPNMATRVPTPAYQDRENRLSGDKELYARIGKIAEEDGGKELIEEFEIPIRSGKAWVVKKGMF